LWSAAPIISGTRAFPSLTTFDPGFAALAAILRLPQASISVAQSFLDGVLHDDDIGADIALLAFPFFRTMLELIGRTNFSATHPRVQRLLEWLATSDGVLRSAILRVIEFLTYASENTSMSAAGDSSGGLSAYPRKRGDSRV
jgi:hypothetical protein